LLQTAQRIADSHFGQISLPVILDALGVRLPRVVDQDKVTAGSRISGTSAGGEPSREDRANTNAGTGLQFQLPHEGERRLTRLAKLMR